MRKLTVRTKVSSLAIAVALVASASPAHAQFVGTIDSSAGIDTVNSTNSNLIITGDQAVINWTATNNPAGGQIIFLPDANSATFSSGSDFAVLNRVAPGTAGNAIYMGGSISSFAGDFTGGTVFFYSPNGIVIGQNASINVGSLGLTTLPISDDGQGNWMSGFGTANPQVSFGQATNPNSFVRTEAVIDGSINANGAGSFVALVAPIIQHSGRIRTDTGAALVAAEAATITFSDSGLYNITVTVGTDAATGIDVDGGTIERRDPTEALGNNHSAYLVAVAKNDAVDMLIRGGGSVGFDTATSAEVGEGNVVILSGGRNVSGGQIGNAAGTGPVNLEIDGANFTTNVEADVSGAANINTDSGNTIFDSGSILFPTRLDLTAGADSIITATAGNRLFVAGDLFASVDKVGTTASPTGNLLRLSTSGAGSELSIGGDATLTARVSGVGEDGGSNDAADVTGGTVIVQSGSESIINIAGRLDISVDAFGGSHAGFNAAAGSAVGGIAHILANGGSGSSITVGGPVTVSASAMAGTIGSDCSANCAVTGGNATGGTILLQSMVGTGNQLNLNSTVDLTADGEGGGGDIAAGSGAGGNIQLVAGDASTITIAEDLTVNADGRGGFGVQSDSGGGQGGSGTGGYVAISFSGAASTINLNGTNADFGADGQGADAWAAGGNATGGWVNIQVGSAGTLNANFLTATANASAGGGDVFNSDNGANGGVGLGGRAWVQATAGGTIQLSQLTLEADGRGGSSSGATGGAGTGGHVIASANNAALTVRGETAIQAQGFGGWADPFPGLGGLGTGGEAQILSDNAATVTLTGSVSAEADGQGGHYLNDGSTGGNGVGGQVTFRATNGSTLDADAGVILTASGTGGFSFGDCIFCGGTGGDGTGGTVAIQANGGAATLLTVAGQMVGAANGQGSSGLAGPGGDGQGGTVTFAIQSGAAANFDGELELQTRGDGGDQFNGLAAGNGTGGLIDAFVGGTGTQLTVDGFAELDASGRGGDAEGAGGIGGNGMGGIARFLGLGGTSEFGGDLVVYAVGTGGDAGIEVPGGTGGNGTGRSARISAAGGTINIAGTASVSASGFGGSGVTGGNGTGGGDYFGGMIDGAHLFAQNGSMVIGGAAVAMSDGFGGNGALGGNGGNGEGGWASIHAANGAGASSITVQGVEASAFVSANGIGGGGGDGVAGTDGTGGVSGGNGGTGGAGGNGGTGTGGVAAITAAAGNGTLNINFGFVDANGAGGNGGSGGTGGAGGFGSNGAGGNGGLGGVGGAGGAAFGGLASIGVEGGTGQAPGLNDGTANFVEMEVTASARGGDGGAGGAGGAAGIGSPNGSAGASGNGGAGGDADGGIAELQARGGTVNLFSALLTSNATGGDGGSGAIAGAGGDAESDEAYVLVTNRPGNTALRGTLNADTIIGEVTSTGGLGSIPGLSTMEGGSGFFVFNGNADIGSLDFTITADSQIADLATDSITLVNADVQVGSFSFSTDGVASIYADDNTPLTPSLSAGTFSVSAGNFIHDPAQTGPATVGVIGADTFSFITGQDLVIDAHLISTSSLNLIAPGLIDIRDATSGGDLTLQAGSTINGGTQTAGGSVLADAPGNIMLNNVVAGNLIDIFSSGGDISLAFLSATNSIDLDAAGNIGFADVTADAFDFSAGGNVNGGDILAGTQATGEAGGAVNLGDINVGVQMAGGAAEDGFAVGIAAEGPISVGNVVADESIGFATLGNLTTGALNAGTDVMTLIGGDTSIASISSGGRTYHGDAQMFLDAGGPDNFDPAEVLAQVPVQSGGSYTVTGAISTGQLDVGAASIATGNITAFNSATLDAAGEVATGSIDTGLLQITAGTDIATGNIFAFDSVDMDAGGSILTGNVDAGSIDLLAGADIATGYLNTRLIFQFGDGPVAQLFPGASITLESGGDISAGNISSIDGVYLNAGGSILTGDIDAFDFVEGHAGTSLATGDVSAGSYVLLTAGTTLSAGAVSASDIDATAGGTATVGGAWSAGNVQVTSSDIDIGANGSISAGDISLTSTNATQTVVGDGVGGGGYQLSDAEYGRLHANDINVIADAGLGAAPNMLIGDLSVDGSDGEGINDYEFITGDSETASATGSIRILGDAVFSNMGNSSVGFTTGAFELDAGTGLLSLENAPGVLGGELFLNAARIHVASGDILDQLAEDPQYDGYQDDLNAPAEVERPDGVIRANIIEIEFGNAGQGQLNTLYVQNMGTSDMPAGFVIGGASLFGEGNEVTPPPGSIDLVINGQIVTQSGTLTGIDVRDALVEAEGDITPFTANSTINGCLLTGACTPTPGGPFPPGFTPLPGLPEEFELVDNSRLPPPPFGNEDFIGDNIETTIDGATSPITPPQPLFDTSALGDKGDIDDPVSGSGNPALMETGPAAACPAGGSQPAGQCKQEKQQ